MDRLFEGYRRFRKEVWPSQRARYETLAKGQQPETLVIACSDSRVDPQTIFGAVPGEMFVLRNVAALVPPYEPRSGGFHGTSAAIEFGVRVLKVERVVVLGHAQCGGVKAMAYGAPPQARDFVAAHYAAPGAAAVFGTPERSPELALALDQFERRGRLPFFEESPMLVQEWTVVLHALGIRSGSAPLTATADPRDAAAQAEAMARKCEAAVRAAPGYGEWMTRALQ